MKRNTLILGSVLLFLIALAITVNVSQAAKPPSDAPATSTIHDFDANGAPYRIGNDSLGSYYNGVNSVESIVQGIGDWVLDTKPSPLRRVRMDFGDPVIGSGANPPFQAAFVPMRFISKCAAWGTFMPGMALGQQALCPLALSIDHNGVTYAVRANENYAGTEPVQWTCLARNSTKCVSWVMVPSVVQADGERKIAMQLIKLASKPRESDQLLGRFYMSFKVNVTTP